jgi:hypothetical protein
MATLRIYRIVTEFDLNRDALCRLRTFGNPVASLTTVTAMSVVRGMHYRSLLRSEILFSRRGEFSIDFLKFVLQFMRDDLV